MVLSIPAGHFQVSFIHDQSGINQTAVCTLGVSYTGSDFNTEANLVHGAWIDNIMAQVSSAWTLRRIVFQTQAGAVKDSAFGFAGQIASAGSPPQVCVIIDKVTNQPGRKNRGRMYIPGVAESGVESNGRLTAGNLNDWQVAANGLFNDLVTANFQPVILHNIPTLPPGPLDAPTDIVQLRANQVVGTQRRRLRG